MNKLYNVFRKKTRLGLMIIILLVSLSLATMLVSADGEDGSTEDPNDPPIDFIDIELIDWQLLDFVNFDPLDFQMRIYLPFNILLIEGPSRNSDVVYIYVNSTLWHSEGYGGDIQTKILRYKSEMEATGFSVFLWEYISGSPEYIRSNLTAAPSDIVGCVFIGNIPSAWFQYFHDPAWGHASYSEFPIDLFYMDLDGIWQDNYNKTGWTGTWPPPSSSDGMYDNHTGNVEPDIWVGRIKGDDMNEAEVGLVKSYFDKNHNYRTGVTANPQNALVYVDDDWSPANGIRDAVATAFPTYNHVHDKAKTKRVNYLENLSNGYSWVHVMCHGNSGSHHFKIPDGVGGSGYEPGPDVVGSVDYKNGDYPVLFYNLFVCSGARFTSTDYLGGWCLFSGDTLGVIGSTKTGSMINDANFYTPLSTKILGKAYRDWFDHTITYAPVGDQPWFYGMTYLGDPTLWATGQHTVTIDIEGLEGETVNIYYTQLGTDHDDVVSSGTWSKSCDHGTQVYISTGTIAPGPNERFQTVDTISWWVNGPLTETVIYHRQFLSTITTSGLVLSDPATAYYVSYGVPQTVTTYWAIAKWCDNDTILSIDKIVEVTPYDERYYTDDPYWWFVWSPLTKTVDYYHQYYITCSATTVIGTLLHSGNSVTVQYENITSTIFNEIWDGSSLSEWMNTGTNYIFDRDSSGSSSSHRWRTPDDITHDVSGKKTTNLDYYEQFNMTITSSGLGFNSGIASFTQFGSSDTGNYHDTSEWNDWCDAGSTLSASEIVLAGMAPPYDERFHNTTKDIEWTVTSSTGHHVVYHMEYKITIMAEGLPDSASTTVTIGVANPSTPDTVSGGDKHDYEILLDSGNSFTWINWVHADTDLTALTPIEYAPNGKYVLICWTKNLVRDDPPTVYADLNGVVYSAQYVGLKKEMSLDDADLCDSLIVTIEVSIPPTGTGDDTIDVIDDLPNEMSYVTGSAMIDGSSCTPIISVETSPDLHQQLAFTVDGGGPHTITITFEVKINRAYESDTDVNNLAGATFDFEDIPIVELDVQYAVTIHPYEGPSLSKATDGPEIVPMFTEVGWVFTYIVKNNYDYLMDDPLLKDHFGAELDYDINTVIANLLTDPDFFYSNGKAKQLRLKWTLPDITIGEAFMLQVTTYTKTDPGEIQLFSTPGEHILNSGANLKWYNDRGKKQSLTTDTISVTAVGQIYGYIKDQYDDGIESAIVEIYYDGALIISTLTDAFGQYNCDVELTESGAYTVKIVFLPDGYDFNGEPQEKTDTYAVGQAIPTEVSFDIIKM